MMWVSWVPYKIYRENQLNNKFISAEQLIKESIHIAQNDDMEKALEYLTLAESVYPGYYIIPLKRGDIFWNQGRYPEAVIAYHQVLQQNNHILEPYLKITQFYLDKEMYNHAATYLDIAGRMFSENKALAELAVQVEAGLTGKGR